MSLVVLFGGLALAALGSVLAVGTAAVSRLELARWVVQRGRGARVAASLLSTPARVFAAANALATAGLVLAAAGLAGLLGPLPSLAAAAGAAIIGVPLLLVLAYTVPRAAGRRWAEPIVRASAPVLDALSNVVAPIVPTTGSRAALDEIFRISDRGPARSSDDLAVVAGLLAFTERPVREVMTPRTEIVAVGEGASRRELLTVFAEAGYSRLPVYAGSLDNIVGMVYAFDLLRAGEGPLPLRPVTMVPGSRRCADLLVELQRDRRQFAVVLDEFGGTAGIVTFEDLLEELVGEIFDEFDVAGVQQPANPVVLEVAGAAPCDDIAARFDVALPADAQTVGGLLTRTLGRIPRTGERIALGDLEFDIVAATPVRVERVFVRRLPVGHVTVAWRGDA